MHYMCEYNRPYFRPFGQHPDDRLPRIEVVAPPAAFAKRLGEMSAEQAAVITQCVEDATATDLDVHFYPKSDSQFIGIALMPGTGPRVRVYEH